MNNLQKMNKMVENNPELKGKLEAEIKRLAESKEAANAEEAMIMAVETVMGIDLTEGTTNADAGKIAELDLDAMDKVSGGKVFHNIEHQYNNKEDAQKQVMREYRGKFPTLIGLYHDDIVDIVNKVGNTVNQVCEWFGID